MMAEPRRAVVAHADAKVELRYMGFDQSQNKRVYKFDCTGAGKSTTRFVVSVDMVLFLKHHVGIQEGPALCARKLNAEFEAEAAGDHSGFTQGLSHGLPQELTHELTNDDLLAYVAVRTAAEVRRAEARRPGPSRRKPEAAQAFTPWRR
jgi:hypothetical protein